jgi:hypothetical protein
MTSSQRNKMLASLGVILLFCLLVVAVHELFTKETTGANDFYPRWRGAQLFWQEGINPYSDEATAVIQTDMYGRLALPNEDQVLFVYPFYVVFLLAPLAWLPVSYSWIQAIWLTGMMGALITAVILTLRLLNWSLPPWLFALTLLWTILFYNSTRTVILGQFAALILLWLAAALFLFKQERYGWAGILLALTTLKPQMTLFVLPALLLWALWQKKWRLIAGFGAAMLALFAISFLFLPSWLTGFIQQVNAYPGYTVTPSPLWIITQYYFTFLGRPVELGLTVILVLYMFYLWWKLVKIPAYSREMLLILGITMIINNMVLVRTATTNFIVLYIPLLLCLQLLQQRTQRGSLWVALFYVLSIFSSWALFLATIDGDQEHVIMFLPLPILMFIVLLWLWVDSSKQTAITMDGV